MRIGNFIQEFKLCTHTIQVKIFIKKSGLALRAGATIREFTFGEGYNFDSYRPMKYEMHNIGCFISILFFNLENNRTNG